MRSLAALRLGEGGCALIKKRDLARPGVDGKVAAGWGGFGPLGLRASGMFMRQPHAASAAFPSP